MHVPWPTTPLAFAAKMGHVGMVTLLLDRGAEVSGSLKVGGTLGGRSSARVRAR